jgi:hypothetical protein
MVCPRRAKNILALSIGAVYGFLILENRGPNRGAIQEIPPAVGEAAEARKHGGVEQVAKQAIACGLVTGAACRVH